MSSPDTPADRAYIAARLAQMDHQLDQAREALETELDLYRDDWSTRHAELQRAHTERMREIEEQGRAFLTSYYDDGTPDVGQGQVDASAAGHAPAPGPGPGQPSAWDAELAEAERIRALPMTAWAQERQSMIRSSNGLFGQQGATRERL